MTASRTAAPPPLLSDQSSRASPLAKLPSFLLVAFVTITLLAIFVPFNPGMPQTGLDQSWIFAANEAVSRHLRFGTDFIFTVGPYASVYTRAFHPATDRLMVLGSLLIGASYVIALLYLARGRKAPIIIILMLFCAAFQSVDALLLSYPFMLVLCALKFVNAQAIEQQASLGWRRVLLIAVSFSALGMLPLTKGSLLVPAGSSAVMLGWLLLSHFPIKQALPLVLIPFASSVFFWIVAGQSLADIPAFLHGTMLLSAGYTEAMSLPPFIDWRPRAVGYVFLLVYVFASAVIAWSIFRSTRFNVGSKWLLGFLSALFLFVAFKQGYVRTGHEPIAFDFLFICTAMICLVQADRLLFGSLVLVFGVVLAIYVRQDPVLTDEVRQTFGVGTTASENGQLHKILSFISKRMPGVCARLTYESAWNTYSTAVQGLRLRLTDSKNLQERFAAALAQMRIEYSVPALQGTADVYTNEQSVLLASGNRWNPRPIIQSYAAYTPELARINEQHLRTANAPDWVLLDLIGANKLNDPNGLIGIDGRLPSLDDGPSWPALLENYTFSSFDGQFVFLRRNPEIKTRSTLEMIYTATQRVGEKVVLPQTQGPLFAEIDLRPTLFGKALIALFQPPTLNIELNLRNGATKSYRVIASMMATGFIVSPLVANTSEFALLAAGDRRFQDAGQVASISIVPSYGNSLFWSGTYQLTLKTRKGPL
jgi:hypothetical protein